MKMIFKISLLLFLPVLVAGQQGSAYLNSLYESIANARSDTAKMSAWMDLGSYYSLEDRDSTSLYLEKALPIARQLELKLDEANILNRKGVVFMQQEKFAKSLEYYLKAINIANDPAAEKKVWNLPAGQTPHEARMLALSVSYDMIGLLNAYTGNWVDNIKNQIKNYRLAEKYAVAAGDSTQLAFIKFHIGIAHMNQGKLDSAVLLIKEAKSTFEKLKFSSATGRTLKYLGETYHKMGNYDLAVATLQQSLSTLKTTNDYVHIALTGISLNIVYTDLKKYDSAAHYARESLTVFEKRKDPVGKRDAYNLLASYYDQVGRTDSAAAYLKLAKSLSDSLGEEERKNLLAFQDVVVEEQAKLEKLEKEKIETREKLRIYLLMGGIIIAIGIATLLYRNNQQKKKTAETLLRQNEEIQQTLHQLKSTQAQLIQSEKMASLGELTAGIAHEIQNPLNFVNNFSEVNKELLEELRQEAEKGNTAEVTAIAKDLINNEEKINHHGKRADAIVKAMLQHSHKGSGTKEQIDINSLADEYLRLAFHGLKAKDKSFKSEFIFKPGSDLKQIHAVRQDIGRVLLNLINNAFYAVKEKAAAGLANYDPKVEVGTAQDGKMTAISVKDNGNGIPTANLQKIFQPFFTTKPTGEGTGLGLSLSYDIIKAHGGDIKVESKEGEGTEFIISLPA